MPRRLSAWCCSRRPALVRHGWPGRSQASATSRKAGSTRSSRCCCWPCCRCCPCGSSGQACSRPARAGPCGSCARGGPGPGAGLHLLMVLSSLAADAACLPAHLLHLRCPGSCPAGQSGVRPGWARSWSAADPSDTWASPFPDLAARQADPEHAGHRPGTGLLFGVVMFAVDPLGLSNRGHQSVAARLDGDPLVGAGLDPAVRRPGRGRRADRVAVPRTRRLQAALHRQDRPGRRRRRAGERDRRDVHHCSRHRPTMLMLKFPSLCTGSTTVGT